MEIARPSAFWTIYVVAVASALTVAALAAPSIDWSAALWFGLAAAALAGSPARVNAEVQVTLTIIADLVAVLFGGLPMMIVTGVVGGLVSGRGLASRRWLKTAYNTAAFVMSAAAAALVYSLVVDVPVMGPTDATAVLGGGGWIVGLLAAALTFVVVNVVLVSAVVTTTSGVPWRETVLAVGRQAVALHVMYAGFAGIAFVLLVRVNALTLVLLFLPVLVARRALLGVEAQRNAFDRMVRAFVKAIEVKDGYTRGHAERVADLSVQVAERMGLSYEERQLIRYGALLHDVGKIGVSLGILCKAGPLTDPEFDEMKLHPTIGAEMLEDIDFLQPALTIVRHHHERMDGGGYPDGMSGDELSLLTRVVTAVDAFDAMTSTRSYRRALPIEVALAELERNAGPQFDPEVVAVLVGLVREKGWELTDEPVAVAAGGDRAHDHVSIVHGRVTASAESA